MNIIASCKQRLGERRVEKQAKAQSDEIDRQLHEESKRRASGKQRDILLIGLETEAFDIVKHMKIVSYPGHYTSDVPETSDQPTDFRPVIWKNLLENSRDMVGALRKLNLDHANRSTEANCEYIMNHRSDINDPEFVFTPRFAEVVQELWAEEILPLLLDDPSAIPLADNAEYLFAEAQRISAEDYVPSMEDVGFASEKGVTETHLSCEGYRGPLSVRVLQVYGQQNWFRKWMPLFGDVTSIMFCVSLADYDEPGISRVRPQTRLAEYLNLFEQVINSPWFVRMSIILFLTGMEEFRAKLHEVPLNQYFPEFTGGTDADEAAQCILDRFVGLNRRSHAVTIWASITEVSDVAAFRHLSSTVRETVLDDELRDTGLL